MMYLAYIIRKELRFQNNKLFQITTSTNKLLHFVHKYQKGSCIMILMKNTLEFLRGEI